MTKKTSPVFQFAHLAAACALTLLTAPLAAQRDSLIAPRAKGSPTAPVTVYEMSDFQCPVCRRFTTDVFPALEKEFITTGKVRWIFINYPLSEIHPNAIAAAEFAACAGKQGKFWPAHDRLYAMQPKWAPLKDPAPFFLEQVAILGLQRTPLVTCLQTRQTLAMIRADAEGARKTGATGTPGFYVEGGLIPGLISTEAFRGVLDSVWKVKTRKR